MADLTIFQLSQILPGAVDANDLFPIWDDSASETKKITVGDLKSVVGLAYWTEGFNVIGSEITFNLSPVTGFAKANVVVKPIGTGGILASIPDGTVTGGNIRGQYAVDFQIGRSNANQVASGDYSVIAGGINNRASGNTSFVGAGASLLASGGSSGVVSGTSNTASGNNSFIGGGQSSTASGTDSFVGGGNANLASGTQAFVGAGIGNQSRSFYSVVGGGYLNTANAGADGTAVLSGGFNSASGSWSCIAGGSANTSGTLCFVGAGGSNTAGGSYSVCAGGQSNTANASWATVGGGFSCTATNNGAYVGGGYDNDVNMAYSGIGAGEGNKILGGTNFYAWIGGGQSNQNSGQHGTIGGGQSNTISSGSAGCIIGGGVQNTQFNTLRSTIGGGFLNSQNPGAGNDNQYNTISGGYGNEQNTHQGSYQKINGGLYARTTLYGQSAHASGRFSSTGDAQAHELIWRREITGTAQTELFLDGASVRAILPGTNSIWQGIIDISAICTNAGGGTTLVGDVEATSYKVTIKRIGTNTVLVGTVQEIGTTNADASMSTGVFTIDNDNANESLRIQYTPPTTADATTVIRVLATFRGTQIQY